MRRRSTPATPSLPLLPLLLGIALWLPAAAEAGFPLSNDPSPLAVCQDTIRTASIRLASEARRTVSACVTAGVECVVDAPDVLADCCRHAARRCRGRLERLEQAEARFAAYLRNRRCREVAFADVLAPSGLGYEALRAACTASTPPGTVADLGGLADCLARLLVADTVCAIGATEVPRGADALACIALDAPRAVDDALDLSRCAPSGGATPTPGTATPTPLPPTATVTVAPSGTPAATPTPVRTATALPTGAATPIATATPIPTATRTPTPVPTSTPTGPVCGNGVQETGESCDDGNTVNCDGCPKNCVASTAPVACSATTVRHAQRIRLTAPTGAVLSGGQICLDYPSGVVALPGTGNVTGRTSNLSGLVTLNDFGDAVQLTFVANPGAAQVNPTISFDLCTGQTAPLPTAFVCEVKGASNQGNPIEPPSLVDCTPVATP
jgi:cysteine-rich repeat protein